MSLPIPLTINRQFTLSMWDSGLMDGVGRLPGRKMPGGICQSNFGLDSKRRCRRGDVPNSFKEVIVKHFLNKPSLVSDKLTSVYSASSFPDRRIRLSRTSTV